MELTFLAHSHNWLIISTILLKLVVSTRGEDFGGVHGSLPDDGGGHGVGVHGSLALAANVDSHYGQS